MSHIILHELQHVIFALRKPPVNLRDVRLSDLSCILLSHQNVLKRGSGIQMSMGRQKQVRASGINAYPISGYNAILASPIKCVHRRTSSNSTTSSMAIHIGYGVSTLGIDFLH